MSENPTDTLPSFDGIADTFVSLGALGSPAELHGMACGKLCGGGRYSDHEWLKSAMEFLDVSRELQPEDRERVLDLYRVTLEQLRDEDFGIELLLPGDEAEMTERVMALSQWCQGFLSGFGTSGVSADSTLSGETAEALRDFAAFVHMSPESEDDEESEMDYLEIVEYVRLAALSIFMEIGVAADPQQPTDNPPTIH
ncbi:UPF0149 family protein [Proteobacteria bacterium 005FR1]|nr:UPF0149 family protein [Proteobacteria bacterium 005FR1]